MTCDDARERFSALVDEALTPAEHENLRTHLLACAGCRGELESFRRTIGLLRSVEPARAPLGFVDRVVAAAQPLPWPRRVLRRLFVPLAIKLPLEAAALVLAGVTAVTLFRQTPELQQAVRPAAPVPEARAPAAPGETTTSPSAGAARRAPVERADTPPASPPASQAERQESRRSSAKLRDPSTSEPKRESMTAPAPDSSGAEGSEAPSGRREAATARAQGAKERAAVDVTGRLVVGDREAARRALTELVTRTGGVEVSSPSGTDAPQVEIIVPRAAYAELADGLARIGRWIPDRSPADLPDRVRIALRITE